jgi:signal transduction histidine kinase
VSASIVKQHGGALEFESSPGVGTTARLALPIFEERT